VKSLRLNRRWSQEQLAHFSGLNVRTIQRVEKGETVGFETLKSLAAAFEISTDEVVQAIESQREPSQIKEQEIRSKAQEKVKSIKYFYAFSAFLVAVYIFTFLPNYNGGENLGSLVVGFISFGAMIVVHACFVFQPFGEKWENKKVAEILNQQSAETSFDRKH